jgi:hypothetical protein
LLSLVGFLYFFNKREEQTTLIEEAAIAAPAIQGGNLNLVEGKSMPAAIGMARTLLPPFHNECHFNQKNLFQNECHFTFPIQL